MALPQASKLTYDDYCLIPADGNRHEIIDGDHFISPAPNVRHQLILGNLFWLLRSFLESTPLGTVVMAPCDVRFTDFDVVQPDLLFVSRERANVVTEKNLQGAPDLAVEILSESTRRTDEIDKRDLFERAGVAEYWIADPVLDTIKIYRHENDCFVRAAELSLEADDVLESPIFPGLTLRLADVFPPRE